MKTNLEELGSRGLCSVEYSPMLKQAVEKAVRAWREFCSLPEEIRAKFPYNPRDGMGVGYELKKTPGTTLDIKEDFHFTSQGQKWLMDQAEEVGQVAVALVEGLAELNDYMSATVRSFALEVEKVYDLPGFAEEIMANSGGWFIRFLHYFGGAEPGDEIAKAHADKSGFTLHLHESDPGLQYLDRVYRWQDISMQPGETVILPGMRGQYRSKGKLKATFHRVVATPETAKLGRFSAVAFIHPDNRVPQYDKAGAGRLQEMKPGFNYEMPFEEFARLFK
jgi:isopenicillin N synthase-like dioxygenase